MSTKPLIAVAGAAGKQGRSVAAALLRSGGGGRVRALTRNPNASQARLLAQAGAEVVAAPLLWDRRRHG
ncbi:NmrA family NAD(P)-binding protein [Selenomonas noxia]|uniref:NmrA family NAD(P)-binding protein n=1 Tax=Selenomonas noxia TaxID=135083 RepID=UPI0028E893C1|nr:NmrA family NAD(P)-binding protein [Selenomonas noxia]